MSPKVKIMVFGIAGLLAVMWFMKSKGALPAKKIGALNRYMNDMDPMNTPQAVLGRPQA